MLGAKLNENGLSQALFNLPPGDWELERSVPALQPGFSVTRNHDGILADAWFEGRLETEFYFTAADNL